MIATRLGRCPALLRKGDYNTTSDRHLGAAHAERLRPDVLISESTYATTLRDSKKSRERDFLQAVGMGGWTVNASYVGTSAVCGADLWGWIKVSTPTPPRWETPKESREGIVSGDGLGP